MGVKSRGCENSTAHESPIQSWKEIRPSVVSASKSGATEPICRAISGVSCRARGTRWRTQPLYMVEFRVLRARRPSAAHFGDERCERAGAQAARPHARAVGEVVGGPQRGEAQRVEGGAASGVVGRAADDE